MKSFECTGLTQNNEQNYHSALRHIITTNDLPKTVLEDLDGTEDLGNMFMQIEEESEADTETEVDEDEDYSDNDSGNRIYLKLINPHHSL